jgi:hypothetical protein
MAGNPNPSPATRFKKGQSGNPKGASIARRGKSMSKILAELGDLKDIKHEGKLVERKTALAHRVWQLALKGDMKAIAYIYDRIDGKAVQPIDVEGDLPINTPHFVIIKGEPMTKDEYERERGD